MKKTFLFVALLSAIVTLQAKNTSAELKSATVFLNGAELKYDALLNLHKGDNEVVIEGLSPHINLNSLQIAIGKGVVVSSYEYNIDYLSENKQQQARLKNLTDSLENTKSKLVTLQTAQATTDKMLQLLYSGVNNTLSSDNKSLTTETIEKNILYFQRRANELEASKNTLASEIKETSATIKRLEQQLQSDGTANRKRSGVLRMNLNSPIEGSVRTSIKYFTPDASWSATYDLNIKDIKSPIDLVMKANVKQKTGIDWNKVSLTLSTGSPNRQNEAPEFSTWRLKEVRPKYNGNNKRYRANDEVNLRSMKSALYAEPMLDRSVAEEDIEEVDYFANTLVENTNNSQQIAEEYSIDIPYTILGNGKVQTIALLQKKIEDVDYTYFAAPKLDNTCFLTAKIKNWNKLNLISGNASITYNGTFYGQTFLDVANTDDEIRLTLGDDQQINVKREVAEDFTTHKIVGSNKTQTYTYKITVRNNKQVPVKLILQEQYPVSAQKEIQVELTDQTTKANTDDAVKGILSYEIELNAGESKVITVGYSVKYPKDMKINL